MYIKNYYITIQYYIDDIKYYILFDLFPKYFNFANLTMCIKKYILQHINNNKFSVFFIYIF